MSNQQSNLNYPSVWREDPSYPGLLQPPADPPPVAKTSISSRGADYHDYVLVYTARQRNHAFMLAAGCALGVAAAFYLRGPWLTISVVLAIGLIFAGGAALAIMAQAHASYTSLLENRTTTYADPRPTPVADVRPVMPAQDNTIRRGRFALPTAMWLRLFDAAERNDGKLTRDNIVKAKALPRELYHGDAFQTTLDELRRLDIIDANNHVTPAGWAFERELRSPHPVAPYSPASAPRTNGNERTANERPLRRSEVGQ
jgi:hypothetical protein